MGSVARKSPGGVQGQSPGGCLGRSLQKLTTVFENRLLKLSTTLLVTCTISYNVLGGASAPLPMPAGAHVHAYIGVVPVFGPILAPYGSNALSV